MQVLLSLSGLQFRLGDGLRWISKACSKSLFPCSQAPATAWFSPGMKRPLCWEHVLTDLVLNRHLSTPPSLRHLLSPSELMVICRTRGIPAPAQAGSRQPSQCRSAPSSPGLASAASELRKKQPEILAPASLHARLLTQALTTREWRSFIKGVHRNNSCLTDFF